MAQGVGGGPKPKPINWDEFDQLCSYQCTQPEIASFFDMSVDNLDLRCRAERGESLSDIWDKRKFLGRTRLRKAQMQIVENMGSGSAAMAIFLGKNLLGQTDQVIPLEPDIASPMFKPPAGKKTYAEFCAAAGYPKPYDAQLGMREFGFDEIEPRLLLGARGYGKTDYVTILGVAYDIYLNGTMTSNLIITKTKARNAALIEEIANALEANGVKLAKRNSTCIRVEGLIGKDHSVEAVTIKTSLRGRHPKRILMDDPVTEEDVSAAMRKTVKRKYDEAYKLCKNLIIIGQPAHAADLYAELRPMLKKLEVPHGTIPELDADLAAMKLAGVDPISIEMSYHLRIPYEGTMPFGKIKYIDKMPAGDSVCFIDPSDGGDYTAITICRGLMDGLAIYGKVWKRAWYHCVPEMQQIFKDRKVQRVAFETNATGSQPIGQLRQVLGNIGVVGIHSDTNKHAAIMAAGSYAHMIHLSRESDRTYTEQVVNYEIDADFDDAPDSLARCLIWLGYIKGKK